MDIFESLENLNVSEECFEDIVGLVEEYIQENVFTAIDKYSNKPKEEKWELSRKAWRNRDEEMDSRLRRKIKDNLKAMGKDEEDEEAFNKASKAAYEQTGHEGGLGTNIISNHHNETKSSLGKLKTRIRSNEVKNKKEHEIIRSGKNRAVGDILYPDSKSAYELKPLYGSIRRHIEKERKKHGYRKSPTGPYTFGINVDRT